MKENSLLKNFERRFKQSGSMKNNSMNKWWSESQAFRRRDGWGREERENKSSVLFVFPPALSLPVGGEKSD